MIRTNRHSETVTTWIELEDEYGGEVEVEVTAEYTPGKPAIWYRPNGDPGDPPEPPEVNIMSARMYSGIEIELNEKQEEQVYNKIVDMMEE
jgi:hypothetical protein